jgi:hypothetical protein
LSKGYLNRAEGKFGFLADWKRSGHYMGGTPEVG